MRKLIKGYRSVDGRVALALVYTAALLTALEVWFLPVRVQERLQGRPLLFNDTISVRAGLEWAGASTVGYMVIPLLIVALIHRQRPSTIGFCTRGFLRHVWVYLGLYALMLPVVLTASKQVQFLKTYPFVAVTDLEQFVRWEIGYVIQFVALEAFFRGYLLFTLEKRMGFTSIFVMAVPYTMIHFHKPPIEAFGALGAGILLGGLALRFRSWLGGALLHALVAVTMDCLAASKAGLF